MRDWRFAGAPRGEGRVRVLPPRRRPSEALYMSNRSSRYRCRQGEVLWQRFPTSEIPEELEILRCWARKRFSLRHMSGHLLLYRTSGWHVPWVVGLDLDNGWADYCYALDLRAALLQLEIALEGGEAAWSGPIHELPRPLPNGVWALANPRTE